MADRVEVADVTIPAGTAQATPLTVPIVFDQGYVTHVDVVIPDGVAGLAGFRVTYAGTAIIPTTVGAWITGNNEKFSDDLAVRYVGQQWALVGYNTDVYDHTFHARFYVDAIGDPPAPAVPTVLPVTITPATVDLTPAAPILAALDVGTPAPTPVDIAPDVTDVATLTDVSAGT